MKAEDASTKLKSPLFCAYWTGQYCLVAGGGGKSSSGLPNRLWCIDQSGAALSQIATTCDTADDAPLRMALPPDHSCILLAVGSGGLLCLDLDVKTKPPVIALHKGQKSALLKDLGHIKSLSFSKNGRLLALGGEDSSLTVLEWPSGVTRRRLGSEITGTKDALRDLDFSSAHGNRVLGAAYEDGSCILWEWDSATQLVALQLPAELQRGSFNRIRFLQDGSPAFLTVANAAGQGHVLLWQQDAHGEMVLQRQIKAHSSAITAFDVSSSGRFLGTGTSEGEVAIFSTDTLAPVRRVARGHMVFATAVAFSTEDKGLLSVSADATARTTLIGPQRGAYSRSYFLAFIVLLVAVLSALYLRTRGFN